ncbi:zinc ribbon domain-containing protein [Desulfoscipio gibsoniae]
MKICKEYKASNGHDCPQCVTEHDRDINAAKNLF